MHRIYKALGIISAQDVRDLQASTASLHARVKRLETDLRQAEFTLQRSTEQLTAAVGPMKTMKVAAGGERCARCDGRDTVDRRYSYGVYAGVLCELCAKSCYRDQCGLRPEGQGTGADYEELAGPGTYDEDE